MDNYIVSARKYRPSTFLSVVGQKSLIATLKNAILSNRLAHAYLFCGPRGVGKTSCARIFAKTINCLSPNADGEACNACESCVAFNEQRSYNIHELDAASNNSVDDIRNLIEQVRIPPAIGKYKVFIIDEVHMLTSAAFNAFLKTLEEPPHHAIFILATTERHKVLPTILSRCQIYDFSRISVSDMVEHLQYVASQEGIHADNDALNVIAQKSDGAMRDALSIFDQVASYTEGNITYQAVIDNLNVLDYDYYFRLTEALLTKQVREALLILNDILAKGFDGQNIISGLAGHLRDLLVCRDESTIVLFEVGASIRERYKEMAKRCPDKWLFAAIDLANRCDLDYRLSRNKRLLLELTLIQICLLGESQSEDSKKKLLTELPEYPATPAPQVAAQPVSQIAEPSLPAVAPPAPVKTEPARRIPSTSLKQMGKSNLQTQQTNTSNNAMRNSPFVEAELLKLWNEYAQGLTNAYLQATMTNCNPVLKDNHTFEVTVFGSMQQDELLNDPNLLPFLRTGLANDSVAMKVTVSDEAAPKIAYTPEEKYNYLLSVNNVIDKLKEEFNLKID